LADRSIDRSNWNTLTAGSTLPSLRRGHLMEPSHTVSRRTGQDLPQEEYSTATGMSNANLPLASQREPQNRNGSHCTFGGQTKHLGSSSLKSTPGRSGWQVHFAAMRIGADHRRLLTKKAMATGVFLSGFASRGCATPGALDVVASSTAYVCRPRPPQPGSRTASYGLFWISHHRTVCCGNISCSCCLQADGTGEHRLRPYKRPGIRVREKSEADQCTPLTVSSQLLYKYAYARIVNASLLPLPPVLIEDRPRLGLARC
jgi:hypothetical protein